MAGRRGEERKGKDEGVGKGKWSSGKGEKQVSSALFSCLLWSEFDVRTESCFSSRTRAGFLCECTWPRLHPKLKAETKDSLQTDGGTFRYGAYVRAAGESLARAVLLCALLAQVRCECGLDERACL